MNIINTVKDYGTFVSAREFWQSNLADGAFAYEKTVTEKIGDILVTPIFKGGDSVLKRIREPYVITAITTAALGLATLLFYPEETINTIHHVIPFTSLIEARMVKFSVYVASELLIFGFGTRAIGRLSNQALIDAWDHKSIVAVSLGAVVKREQ